MEASLHEIVQLHGELQPRASLVGQISSKESLTAELSARPSFSAEILETRYLPYYDGKYHVTPDFVDQTLETSGKNMKDDVSVGPIYVSETSNPAGGNTVYIGGDIVHG